MNINISLKKTLGILNRKRKIVNTTIDVPTQCPTKQFLTFPSKLFRENGMMRSFVKQPTARPFPDFMNLYPSII